MSHNCIDDEGYVDKIHQDYIFDNLNEEDVEEYERLQEKEYKTYENEIRKQEKEIQWKKKLDKSRKQSKKENIYLIKVILSLILLFIIGHIIENLIR